MLPGGRLLEEEGVGIRKMADALIYSVLSILGVCLLYLIVRLASVAYFKSKQDFLRRQKDGS